MPRRSNGGRSSSVVNLSLLHRRLESCKNKYLTVEEIVNHLRSSYSDYSRIKQQPLTRVVRQALESPSLSSSKKRNNQRQQLGNLSPEQSGHTPFFQDDSEEEEFVASRRKLRKVDKSEERLRKIEDSYIRKNQRANCQDNSSTNSDDSVEDDDDNDEEGGFVSTSEDAIYEEKVEPDVDLMKVMLRASYANSKPKKNVEQRIMEVELDVDSEKSKQRIGAITGTGEKKEEGKSLPSTANHGIEESRFKDFGGMKDIIEQLKRQVLVPLYHPQLPRELGIKQENRGILFYGPPGCGKTKLAHAIANETGLPFYKISATEIVSAVTGASEENIRDLFAKAYRTAPSIVFIDEIDAIASKRENTQRGMERRIVTQLMTCMDESHRPTKSSSSDKDAVSESPDIETGHVLVIGATNRPDDVDSALRRPGRFDMEIYLGVPDENARLEILSVVTRNHKLEGSFDLRKIARLTPGFVGADLKDLASKAGTIAMNRTVEGRKVGLCENLNSMDQNDEWKEPFLPEDLTKLSITMADYEEAVKVVQPSSRREGFSTIPNVKWEDVGGLESLRRKFNQYIIGRITNPEKYEKFGLNLETGFLLFGPPGCGKTLIAKAVANEAGANFIHIKGPELLNQYVGESEKAVRTLFSRARTCSPCILFFDEVDALTKQRGKEGGWVVERVLNQLLIELDGGNDRRGVFVIGATNRIDVIDNALLRPGRFGKLYYVHLPSADERSLILKALGRNKAIDPDVDLDSFARLEACEGLSGADLNALMNDAGMAAIQDDDAPETIKLVHFEKALDKISPSVSKMDIQLFDRLAKQFKADCQ